MSKVEELRARYNKIANPTFEKFVKADLTPTKKYLEWMCKIWDNRDQYRYNVNSFSSLQIVKTMMDFDILLPYLADKDIYSKNNTDYPNLRKRLDTAKELKADKEFKREGNIEVLFEDDTVLFLRPLTVDGTLKYGSKTRWCTASKTSPGTFLSYFRQGYLVYLISKNENKSASYNKVAFYIRTTLGTDPLIDSIDIYSQTDSRVKTTDLVKNGWDEKFILRIIFEIRFNTVIKKRVVIAKSAVDKDIKTIETINFNEFYKNLEFLECSGTEYVNYVKKANETMSNFLTSIKEKITINDE